MRSVPVARSIVQPCKSLTSLPSGLSLSGCRVGVALSWGMAQPNIASRTPTPVMVNTIRAMCQSLRSVYIKQNVIDFGTLLYSVYMKQQCMDLKENVTKSPPDYPHLLFLGRIVEDVVDSSHFH